MAGKNAETCIVRILRDIDRLRDVDFGDNNSLRRYNAAMRRIAENVALIDETFPNDLGLFVELCNHPDPFVVDRCARRVFELTNTSKEHKRTAFDAMFRRLADPTLPNDRAFFVAKDLITWIASEFPEELDHYVALMCRAPQRVAYWCASSILNSDFPDREQKIQAFGKLQELNRDKDYPAVYKLYLPDELAQWEKMLF